MKLPFFILLLSVLCQSVSGQQSMPSEADLDRARNNFEIQKLAEGVYGVIRKDLPGLMVDANNVFIINETDVIVVDTNGAPSTTKLVIEAIRKITNKPVKYVINTHWHDDHIMGDPEYRAAFPGVEFIGHANMRAYLPANGAKNRKGFLEGAPQVVEQMKTCLQTNKTLSGKDMTPEERESYLSDIQLVELALGDAPKTEITLPTISFQDRLSLYRGDRVIEILHLGSGHTSGDIVVHLPKERIVVTGDLVVWPVPLVGSDQSYISDWSVTLEKVMALQPAIIVPGHGPVLREDSYLKLMSDLFASVAQQTQTAVSRAETLDQALKSVNLDDFKKRFAGDSAVRNFLFDVYVKDPAVRAAYRDATTKS